MFRSLGVILIFDKYIMYKKKIEREIYNYKWGNTFQDH